VQNSSQTVTTNKLTPSFFTGRMPFLSPNQQCQSIEGKMMMNTIINKNNNQISVAQYGRNFRGVSGRQAESYLYPLFMGGTPAY